jgi:hypothetical protein
LQLSTHAFAVHEYDPLVGAVGQSLDEQQPPPWVQIVAPAPPQPFVQVPPPGQMLIAEYEV